MSDKNKTHASQTPRRHLRTLDPRDLARVCGGDDAPRAARNALAILALSSGVP